jgi:uncharacterized protein
MLEEIKNVCIAGASGFIGRHIMNRLLGGPYQVKTLSRDDFAENRVAEKLAGSHIVVNLTGESIAGIWTKGRRRRIYDSRVYTLRKIVRAINEMGSSVNLLIQVSAVGIYDHEHVHGEDSMYFDRGFLSRVIEDWEGELKGIEGSNVRVVILRLGIVLDPEGGLLKSILKAFRLRLGFGIRSSDYFPFIHIHDLEKVMLKIIEDERVSGVVNVVSPSEVQIEEFYKTVNVLKNTALCIWIPLFLLQFIMGESASLLIHGQHVIPKKLLDSDFKFNFPDLAQALKG